MLLARHNHVVLYLGTAMLGMFLSSVAPTSISLAESYIDVTCTSFHAGHVLYSRANDRRHGLFYAVDPSPRCNVLGLLMGVLYDDDDDDDERMNFNVA